MKEILTPKKFEAVLNSKNPYQICDMAETYEDVDTPSSMELIENAMIGLGHEKYVRKLKELMHK